MFQLYLSLLNTEEEKNHFEQIYLTYRNLMFYVAKRILNDDLLAEDAVHNAFLKIIDHLDKLKDVNSNKTKGFMVIVVENTAKNIYNQQKFNKISLDSSEMELAYVQTFEEKVIDKISVSYLVEKIEHLPDTYRDVLMMRYIYELSYKEISKLLKISEPTVRKRVERAKQKLAQNIGELIYDWKHVFWWKTKESTLCFFG